VDKDTVCLAHIRATFNNTFITITRPNGDAMVVMSTGRIGYKKSKRSMICFSHVVLLRQLFVNASR
jgi:small subunit ribosomal protein S11